MTRFEWRPWLVVAAFSLVLFLITASTYSALGVVLPNMVRDEGWSWGVAGFGFTLLGAATGASSFVPAYLIRKLGVRATLALGTGLMGLGFVCLASAHGPLIYFAGAALCGVGFQTMALIPGTHVLAMVFKDRGVPFGVYFASGSVGGIAGPVMALGLMRLFHDQWRMVWVGQAIAAVVVGVICILMVGPPAWFARRAQETDRQLADQVARPRVSRVYRTAADWTVRQALRTPQFYVLLAAYFGHMLVGITISSFSIAHLTQRGVSLKTAGVMLSIESLVGVAGRAAGGALGDRLDPRYLLAFALAVLGAGSVALSLAHGYGLLLVYALGSGLGFGLTQLTCTLLLLNYYGRTHNLEIFSRMCLIGVFSAFGPWIAGLIRDHTGEFSSSFQIYAAVVAVILAAVAFMRPPTLKDAAEARRATPDEPLLTPLDTCLVEDPA